MRFSHVVLDLDGTLVDTTAAQTVAVNEVLQLEGRAPLDHRTVRRIAGSGLRAMLREAFHLTGEALNDPALSEQLARLRPRYDAHLLELTVLAPGLGRAMRDLRLYGVRISVLSNKPKVAAAALLDHADIAECIGFLVAGDMGYPRKPDPHGLLSLMASVGSGSEDTLLCGSMRIDLKTARNARIPCASCSPFIEPGEVLALGADYMLHEVGQLLPLCTGRRQSGAFRGAG